MSIERMMPKEDMRAAFPVLPGDSPVATMRRVHADKLRLCDALEAIADALPDAIDRVHCLSVASELVPMLRAAHRFEECYIFPLYAKARGDDAEAPSLARLKAEHVEDECFADEITETLLAIGRGGPIGNAEATGFMLRGFFEMQRRHIAFEREHILPLAERAGGGA